MDLNVLLTIETAIMFIFLLPFYAVFFFMIVAARHARNERRLACELRAMATEEEAAYWRCRQEAQERQEKLAEEERALLLRDAVRQVVDSDNESSDSDDEEEGLHIFFKERAGPAVSFPGGCSPDKGNKRA